MPAMRQGSVVRRGSMRGRERPASGDAAAANYEIDQAVRRLESRVESLRPTAGTERQEEGGQPERTPVEADGRC